MKPPRLSISGLMAVVLIVALDFGLGKALTSPPLFSMQRTELLLIGGFPMGNILAAGLAVLVASRRSPGPGRPGLVGSVAAGLLAWLGFLACSLMATRPTHDSVRGPIELSGLQPGLGLASFVALLFLLPQLGVATLGWWLGRRYLVPGILAIERADAGIPGSDKPGTAGEGGSY